MEKASELLQAGLDAMRAAHGKGLKLYMSDWVLFGGEYPVRVTREAPEGQICAVCAGGSLALARRTETMAKLNPERGFTPNNEELALDAFRYGGYVAFSKWLFRDHEDDGAACRNKVAMALEMELEPKHFDGLIEDPTEMFAHFEKAIGILQERGL